MAIPVRATLGWAAPVSAALISAARAIGNFRRCVIGDWGSSVSYAECITRDAGAPEGIDGLSRVVNTTAMR